MPWCCPKGHQSHVPTLVTHPCICAGISSHFSLQAVQAGACPCCCVPLFKSSPMQWQSAVLTLRQSSSSEDDDGVKWVLYVCGVCVCLPRLRIFLYQAGQLPVLPALPPAVQSEGMALFSLENSCLSLVHKCVGGNVSVCWEWNGERQTQWS